MTEFWERRAKQLLVISGLILLLFVFVKFAKYFADVLVIIGISILIAYLFIGPVDLLTRIVKFRTVAVMLVYLIILGFLITILIFVAPKVTKEFGEFTKEIPNIVNFLDGKVSKLETFLNKNNIYVNLSTVKSIVTTKLTPLTVDPIGNVLGVALSTFHFIFYILVTAVTSYYFLLDGHKIADDITQYIPKKYQCHIRSLITELDKCLRGFYGGMVKLALINATVMFTTYLIMKVPYSLLLAIWHFLWCIIPVVGGWVGLVPALLVIALTDPYKVWIPLVVYEGFTRLIKDNFITPRIMGDAIGMHPVLVLIAVLVGLKTAGLIGVLFALPTFGVLNVIFKYSLKQLQSIEENL
ncbi:MAG: AI-2E family transporter [Candidatus Melainabacteria bacterium]|nr:AI-2E family transporter [Candidatus Melainabacteria bacterium]